MKGLRLLLVSVAACLLLAAWVTPCLATHGMALTSAVLQSFFHAVCHQRPERSFWLYGQPWAVCTRCLGVYTGLLAGALLPIDSAIAKKIFLSVLLLNVVDVLAERAGFHGSMPWLRLALGAGLGAAASALLVSRAWKYQPR